MSHEVRTHTRTVKGKTVTVRQHKAADPAAEQRKRDAFERRVLRERQEAAHPDAYPARRAPGQRKRRTKRLKPARAKRHAKKALRLWRRHKVKAVLFAALAAGEITAWAAMAGAGKARRAVRAMRKTKGKGKTKR